MFRYFNPNPAGARVGDCVIRAICKATNQTWQEVYASICCSGYKLHDMPSSDAVWGDYLCSIGFTRNVVPAGRNGQQTVRGFADAYPHGTYLMAISGHVVCVQDGDYYDTWDSGDCIPIYYWTRKRSAL